MSRRPEDDERIADWVDDRLDEVQRARFEAELRVNPALRAAAEEYRRTVGMLQRALRGESLADGSTEAGANGGELRVRHDFADRVMTAIADQRRRRGWRLVPWLGSAVAAASIVGLWLFLRTVEEAAPHLAKTAAGRPDADAAVPSPALAEEQSKFGFQKDLEAEGSEPSGIPAPSEAPVRAGGRGAPPASEPTPTRESAAGEPAVQEQLGQSRSRDDGLPGAETKAEAPLVATDGSAAIGPLVYLVQVPAPALEALRPDAGENERRLRESQPREQWQELARQQGARALVESPLLQKESWVSNVLMPQLADLQMRAVETMTVAPSEDLEEDARKLDSTRLGIDDDASSRDRLASSGSGGGDGTTASPAGRYEFRPGDQVFQIEGDEAQVQRYLSLLMSPVRQAEGSIAVQRATGLASSAWLFAEPSELAKAKLPGAASEGVVGGEAGPGSAKPARDAEQPGAAVTTGVPVARSAPGRVQAPQRDAETAPTAGETGGFFLRRGRVPMSPSATWIVLRPIDAPAAPTAPIDLPRLDAERRREER